VTQNTSHSGVISHVYASTYHEKFEVPSFTCPKATMEPEHLEMGHITLTMPILANAYYVLN